MLFTSSYIGLHLLAPAMLAMYYMPHSLNCDNTLSTGFTIAIVATWLASPFW